jgi:hypothetical protein
MSVSSEATAQTADSALAEALFRSARVLVNDGKYAEACPKFAESQRIDPKLGTLMNLALCHQGEGKTASAWAEYTQAAELAARAGQGERERVARKSAADLEAKLPRITLQTTGSDAVTVTWDGKTMGAAAMGTAFPVDPGNHELVASAPGKKTYTQTVNVSPGPGSQTLTIPVLEVGAPVVAAVAPQLPPPPRSESKTGHPILGYSLLAGGGAAIVVGAVFGGLAFSQKSAANGQCTPTNQCTLQGLSDISSLKTDEATSTVAIGVGIVAAGAGLVFVLTSKKHEESANPSARITPLVGPGEGGLALSGRF